MRPGLLLGALAATIALVAIEPTGVIRNRLPFLQPDEIVFPSDKANPQPNAALVGQAAPTTTPPAAQLPAVTLPGVTPPASSAPQAATAARPGPKVDETALRYFARRGDTKRLETEIARLKALYPDWTPPADPLNAGPNGDPQLDAMWKLYADGKLADLRKAINDRLKAEPTWQVPSDLQDRLAAAEAREQLINASNLKQYETVIRVGASHASLLTCGDVDVLWRVAEAFALTDKQDRARDAYTYVLTNCADAEERLATAQKAASVLSRANVDVLLAMEKKDSDGKGEFEPVRLQLARQALADADADAKLVVAPADIERVRVLATESGLVSDDLLLGWYYVRRDGAEMAERFFRQAYTKENTAETAQGLALALVDLNRPDEAEEILHTWRDTNDDIRAVYLAAVANFLGVLPPPDITQERLGRMVAAVVAAKDVPSGQQLGWYADALNQFTTAEQWFLTALNWKADDEPSAYGLALVRWKLGNDKGVKEVQALWADRSERIATVGEPSIETAAISLRVPDPRGATATPRVAEPRGTTTTPPVTEPRGTTAEPPIEQPRRQPQPVRGYVRASEAPVAEVIDETVSARMQPDEPRRATVGRAAPRGCATGVSVETLSPQSALTRGWCLMELNRPVEAAKAFEVALRGSGQTREDAAYGQSLAYMRAGLSSRAAASAAMAPMRNGRDLELKAALLSMQATSAFEHRRYNEALIALDERAQIVPEQNDLLVLRGYAYFELKRYEDAERMFRAAAATGNKDARRGISAVKDARATNRSR